VASGNWSKTDLPVRPGFYMNFVAAALAAITPGARGIVAIPVKANWGPIETMVQITSETDLDNYYGEASAPYTAHDSIYLALLGQPQTVLAYRMADASAAKGSVTLKDSAVANALTLTTKYESTRAFNVTVRNNPVSPATMTDIVLFEGTAQLVVITFAKGAGIAANAVAAIAANANNTYINATSPAPGNGTLAAVSNVALTGGNDGLAGITNTDYTAAMSAFEAQTINAFTLDGATDPALQTSVAAWIARIRRNGKMVTTYMGGTAVADQEITAANAQSLGFNVEGVINVGVSGILDGVTYPSAMVACYIAGLTSGQALSESLTYAVTAFQDVTPRLTNDQVIAALNAGTLVLTYDGEHVIVEQGIDTLTTFSETQGKVWRKIKCIRIMDAIATDTAKAAQSSYVGKILNNTIGQTALLCAIKQYFETLAPDLLDADFTVQTDADAMKTAESDQFFWTYTATIVDSMERIFGTGCING
jgi:hypothetical protein